MDFIPSLNALALCTKNKEVIVLPVKSPRPIFRHTTGMDYFKISYFPDKKCLFTYKVLSNDNDPKLDIKKIRTLKPFFEKFKIFKLDLHDLKFKFIGFPVLSSVSKLFFYGDGKYFLVSSRYLVLSQNRIVTERKISGSFAHNISFSRNGEWVAILTHNISDVPQSCSLAIFKCNPIDAEKKPMDRLGIQEFKLYHFASADEGSSSQQCFLDKNTFVCITYNFLMTWKFDGNKWSLTSKKKHNIGKNLVACGFACPNYIWIASRENMFKIETCKETNKQLWLGGINKIYELDTSNCKIKREIDVKIGVKAFPYAIMPIRDLIVSPDNKMLFVLGWDGKVRMIDLDK